MNYTLTPMTKERAASFNHICWIDAETIEASIVCMGRELIKPPTNLCIWPDAGAQIPHNITSAVAEWHALRREMNAAGQDPTGLGAKDVNFRYSQNNSPATNNLNGLFKSRASLLSNAPQALKSFMEGLHAHMETRLCQFMNTLPVTAIAMNARVFGQVLEKPYPHVDCTGKTNLETPSPFRIRFLETLEGPETWVVPDQEWRGTLDPCRRHDAASWIRLTKEWRETIAKDSDHVVSCLAPPQGSLMAFATSQPYRDSDSSVPWQPLMHFTPAQSGAFTPRTFIHYDVHLKP